MKVPWGWLTEYCPSPWSVEETAERLSGVGVAVEGIVHRRFTGEGIVAGKIVSVSSHPARKDLLVGQVDVGTARYTVVSGAPGFKPGVVTAFAPPGSRLPGGAEDAPQVEVRTRLVDGVTSEGMVLCVNELLRGAPPRPGEDLVIFPPGTRPGVPVEELIPLDDHVLELELTPSFSHCLSIIGVAVELSALSGVPVKLPSLLEKWSFLDPRGAHWPGEGSGGLERSREPVVEVVLDDPDLCPVYVGKPVFGVRFGYSPVEVERRLELAGMRPINAVVDATNYVMLETGQPLHAFDLDKLEGGIIRVRRSRPGEYIVTLDGVRRDLPPGTLVIADAVKPVAIAGIMGGLETEVSEATRNVLLESAWFNPTSVRTTSLKLGLMTEAQARFEKGIDPTMQVAGVERAAELVAKAAGGVCAAGWSIAGSRPGAEKKIWLHLGYLRRLLGSDIGSEEAAGVLGRLGFSVRQHPGKLEVTVPPRRVDVSEEVDLVEEVARHVGYQRFPGVPLSLTVSPSVPASVRFRERARDVLRALGGNEVIMSSLLGPDDIASMGWESEDPRSRPLKLANPLTSEESVLRTSLIPGLLKALRLNKRYKVPGALVWEVGTVFFPAPEKLPLEKTQIGVGAWGTLLPKTWNSQPVEADFYYLKGYVGEFLRYLGAGPVSVERGAGMPFHPGRSGRIVVRGIAVGELGELHPKVTEAYDLDRATVLAWLDFDSVMALSSEPRYRPLPKFPRAERDLAVIAPDELDAAAIEAVVRREARYLVDLRIFDLWKGHPIPTGKKSIAFSMTFGSEDRTLTDEEVDAEIERIVKKLQEELGVTLR